MTQQEKARALGLSFEGTRPDGRVQFSSSYDGTRVYRSVAANATIQEIKDAFPGTFPDSATGWAESYTVPPELWR